MNELENFAEEIHQHNVAVGWWDNDPCIYEKMQLISTEIAEATEGERKDLMDDKLPHRKMGEVELADALIRTLDLGERLGLEIHAEEYSYHATGIESGALAEKWTVGRLHLVLNAHLISWFHNLTPTDNVSAARYSAFIGALLGAASSLNYFILTAAREKHEFNKTRADHKRENRAKQHGKKF